MSDQLKDIRKQADAGNGCEVADALHAMNTQALHEEFQKLSKLDGAGSSSSVFSENKLASGRTQFIVFDTLQLSGRFDTKDQHIIFERLVGSDGGKMSEVCRSPGPQAPFTNLDQY